MKRFTLVAIFCLVNIVLFAQSPGDTILVNTFTYANNKGSGVKDTVISFPNLTGVNFEKIYMLYNMRCKNALVSSSSNRNQGCGEWDYSCNTYITDSSKTDSVKASFPTHVIKGFKGNVYPYTLQPTYSYYQYIQKHVTNTSVINQFDTTIGLGAKQINAPFQCSKGMAKSQFLWKASELLNAGIMAGNITSLKLNISNSGTTANFLRIKIKPTTDTILSSLTPHLSGFTEVYFANTMLVNGMNEFVFYNNFNWNGTDNLIIEFNFENNISSGNAIVSADSMPNKMGLIAEGNDYSIEFTGSNYLQLGAANFTNFSNQISISFWSNGNANLLPTNTTVAYATNSKNDRQVNIHLPWSNSNIYFDCGSGGTSDRINKVANNADFKGNWNHWVFTKNTTSGIMKIYLNGALFQSGTGKTIPIQITDFQIGNQHGLINPYFGKIDEFSIWNTELSAATILSWKNKSINFQHPNYSNLIAHYNFNEGVGNTTADSSNALTAASLNGNPIWRKTKANEIFKGFFETNYRPTLTFVQGTYNQNIIYDTIIDSVINNQNIVYSYKILSNKAVAYDTTISYTAGYVYKYDGETNAVIDSVLIPATNTITIGTLNYYKLSPSRFQIMSFVTPYGIGLDLGPNGKTWTFDVTDLTPILKGKKLMTIDAGGEWQEELDIKFMYIVGTPPHDVKDINNIWKVDNANIANIKNDNYFEPRSINFSTNASSYKIRTAITGHGQEGEFIPQNHYLNINGAAKEFQWNVWKPCASNPIYPQGGTWIYDRAGWCPGAPTDLQENDITSYVAAGGFATIDYGIDTAWGDSRYWVSSQLVGYGAPNFNVDAAIVDIKTPSKKIEYLRINTICTDPTIVIKNTGATDLTSLVIEYWVNNNSSKNSYTWHGNLKFLESTEVVLPVNGNLWSGITSPNDNIFHVAIKNPNGGSDAYSFNNTMKSTFDIPPVLPSDFTIWFRTNQAASESSYILKDASGAVLFNKTNMSNNSNYYDDFTLSPGCYSLEIKDSDDDGFDFWANSDGAGKCQIKDMNNQTIHIFDGDFGRSILFNFTVEYPLSYNQMKSFNDESLTIFPNPAQHQFNIDWNNHSIKQIEILNSIGQKIEMPITHQSKSIQVNCSGYAQGFYFVAITNEKGETQYKKIIIE